MAEVDPSDNRIETQAPFSTKEEQYALVVLHRERLADLLARLEPEQWDHATLCREWAVRHVVGHLLTPALRSSWRTLGTSIRSLGLARGLDRTARDIGSLPPEELVRLLRAHVENVWIPPTMGLPAPLTDILVHTQDIARPLGLDVPVAAEHVDPALTFCVSRRSNQLFGPARRYAGVRLIATDLKWKCGKGPEVHGPALELLMAVTGRPSALENLEGEGVAILAKRLRVKAT